MTQRMLNANQRMIYDAEIDKFGKAFEYLGGAELTAADARCGPVFIEPRQMLVIIGRVTSTVVAAIPQLRFNDDEGANYWDRNMSAAIGGATFSNTGTPSATSISLSRLSSLVGKTFFSVVMNVPGLSHPTAHSHYDVTGAAATVGEIEFGSGEWASTDIITSVLLMNSAASVMGVDTGFAIFGKDFA